MSHMRHRIHLQRDESEDGNVDPDFQTFARKVPCNIVPVSGMENFRGRKLMETTKYVIETRYYSKINSHIQAVNALTGDVYYFNGVIDVDGRQRYMMIEAFTEEAE